MLDKLLGSKVRAKSLSWLFSHPDERFFVRQLASILGEDIANLSRELARLASMGILMCQSEGREKYYRADKDCPFFQELQGLVIKTTGVADVLRVALGPLAPRIRVAFVFGSLAKGEPRAGSDVDLMVVGDVKLVEVVSAIGEAQKALGREVNPTVYPADEVRRKAASDHLFIKTALTGPKIFLLGDERELAGLVEVRLAEGT